MTEEVEKSHTGDDGAIISKPTGYKINIRNKDSFTLNGRPAMRYETEKRLPSQTDITRYTVYLVRGKEFVYMLDVNADAVKMDDTEIIKYISAE